MKKKSAFEVIWGKTSHQLNSTHRYTHAHTHTHILSQPQVEGKEFDFNAESTAFFTSTNRMRTKSGRRRRRCWWRWYRWWWQTKTTTKKQTERKKRKTPCSLLGNWFQNLAWHHFPREGIACRQCTENQQTADRMHGLQPQTRWKLLWSVNVIRQSSFGKPTHLQGLDYLGFLGFFFFFGHWSRHHVP